MGQFIECTRDAIVVIGLIAGTVIIGQGIVSCTVKEDALNNSYMIAKINAGCK